MHPVDKATPTVTRTKEAGPGAEQGRAWRLFLSSYRAVIDVLAAELERELGLPLTWYEVLDRLHCAPEQRLAMGELADLVLITRSAVTRRVDRMVQAGLVERAPCATDRRISYALLTPKGTRAFEEAVPVHLEGVERHFSRHLTPTEARAIARGLAKIDRAVGGLVSTLGT